VILPERLGCQPVRCLALAMLPERLRSQLRQQQNAPALLRLRVLCPAIWGIPVRRRVRQFRLTKQGCQSKLTGMDIEKLSVDVSSDDPAVGLRASLALHRLAERVEANHVAAARGKGWSWQQIGDALGVTRQSVHTKYNKESS
jgi:hypothetical protein